MVKFYLTTPIYYVNAKPHIGHAYTTLAADSIARYYKQKIDEENVFFLTGTDEHGTNIAEAAKKENKNPKAYCDDMIPFFKETWSNLDIDYSHFIRTTDEYHEKGAKEFLSSLKDKGALYEDSYTGLYCNNCESFKTEKELDAAGNCPDHKTPPRKISEKNWFFKLSDYTEDVKKLVESGKLKIEPKERKKEVLGLFKQGMADFSISRPTVKWGIPLPWDEKQTIYVWVEALLNYFTALGEEHNGKAEHLSRFWPPNLQLIGKDIIKFHCIYWPAMLLAYFNGDTNQLPNKIFVHGFFTVNGQKMSKTLGNVIDPNDLVNEYGKDAARYLILSQFPFGQDGDIEESKFTEKYNSDLANGIGNLVSRVSSLCLKQVTTWDLFWENLEHQRDADNSTEKHDELMLKSKLFEAIKLSVKQAQQIDSYLAKQQPWKLDKDIEQKKIIDILVIATHGILKISNQLKPFLPATVVEITKRFDINNKQINQGNALFPRK